MSKQTRTRIPKGTTQVSNAATGEVKTMNKKIEMSELIEHERYSGRSAVATIGHVTTYQQKDGYVVFSLYDLRCIKTV